MDAVFADTAFLDGVWDSWAWRFSKAAFLDITSVDACRKCHFQKVGTRCFPTTCISVLSSHNCFDFNSCATLVVEDKVEYFFEEEEEKDTGAKEGGKDASDNNVDKPPGKNGGVYAPGWCTGRRACLGLSQGGTRTRA